LEAASEQEASPPAARRADQAERNIASSDGTNQWGKCLRIREGYCSSSMICCLENKTRIKEHDTRTIRG
jgi:hypothetical protein